MGDPRPGDDDFYEDDEPLEDVLRQYEQGAIVISAPRHVTMSDLTIVAPG
jgi:hypothetical protein